MDRKVQPGGPDASGSRLRESAQRLGLLRKVRNRLVLTNAAKQLLADPDGLWRFLARSLAQRHRRESERDATLLLALEIAAGKRTGRADYTWPASFGLGTLGWTTKSGWELPPEAVDGLLEGSWDVLVNLCVFDQEEARSGTGAPTPQGRAFARAILHTQV